MASTEDAEKQSHHSKRDGQAPEEPGKTLPQPASNQTPGRASDEQAETNEESAAKQGHGSDHRNVRKRSSGVIQARAPRPRRFKPTQPHIEARPVVSTFTSPLPLNSESFSAHATFPKDPEILVLRETTKNALQSTRDLGICVVNHQEQIRQLQEQYQKNDQCSSSVQDRLESTITAFEAGWKGKCKKLRGDLEDRQAWSDAYQDQKRSDFKEMIDLEMDQIREELPEQIDAAVEGLQEQIESVAQDLEQHCDEGCAAATEAMEAIKDEKSRRLALEREIKSLKQKLNQVIKVLCQGAEATLAIQLSI
ncbi:hypothetical protein CC79DRAFT_1381931 [Sarocladium strictum]